ncbi:MULTISPECIES: hypothetical protein [Dickeya]|uniref:hypothetical protein n=1 Tax=Dickeya TaxID=204037 RepID=UPI000FCC7DCA|nr:MULTISPECIES: hypothetical protein [Dickeya]UGA52894.1 hypothetical protein QR68_09830 [Dickeya fangzhongdai]UWH09222.1 hypothetical protein K0H75_09820 [Dickeya fangzhongdai]
MANRDIGKTRTRRENTREERKVVQNRELMTFSFKYFDQSQPLRVPETIDLWQESRLLKPFFNRLIEISKLTRDEALGQRQIKIYGDFPPSEKTAFTHPQHVEENVAWAVIEGIGGKPRVAGFVSESTFYVVFLDSEHKFWISEKRHT